MDKSLTKMNYSIDNMLGSNDSSLQYFLWNNTDFESNVLLIQQSFYKYHKPEKIVFVCIYAVIFLLALVGNTLVLVMVCINKRFRRNIANFFLVNLAVADILVTLICMPLTMAETIYTLWMFGEFLCKSLGFIQGVCVEGSVLTIVCMSAERYVAIRHPMKLRSISDTTRVRQVILFTWLIAMVIMCPLALYKNLDSHQFEHVELNFCAEKWPSSQVKLAYDIFLVFIVYVIPGTVVVVLYTLIGCSLWRQDNNLQRANSMISNDSRLLGGRRKLAKMMIIISVLFAVSWCPYFLINICLQFSTDTSTLMTIYPYALLLGHSNSVQNPILYCFMHKGFHDFIVRLFRCQCAKITGSRQPRQVAVNNECTGMTSLKDQSKKSNSYKYDSAREEKKRLMVMISDPL